MSDLDQKLREIGLYDVSDSRYTELGEHPETIARIKQAFADEGYVIIPRFKRVHMETLTVKSVDGEEVNFMTGQEWHDRFEKELEKISSLGDISPSNLDYIKQAAKKASNLPAAPDTP